jgi:anti-anti-sigma regulatory factor
MTVTHPSLASCEVGLMQCVVPVWAFDAETIEYVFANDPALELWGAQSRAELFARDFSSGSPELVLARTRRVVGQLQAGKTILEEWTFFPRGTTTTVVVDLRGVMLEGGRFGVLAQALPIPDATPASLQRVMTMSRHLSGISALVTADGSILSQNPAALQMFGEMDSWLGWFPERTLAQALLRRAVAGERMSEQVQVAANGELRWHLVEAQQLRDPVSGELGALIEHSDVMARVEAEHLAETRAQRIDTLHATLELVERQRREIIALSAPILDVGRQTLAVPIIGRLDDNQSAQIMATLLDAVARGHVRHVILDLTGVSAADEGSTIHLVQMIHALRLLGAAPMITGIRPTLAMELIASGFDLDDVPTLRSLAEGLRRSQ